MKEKHIKGNESKGIFYDALEGFAQERIREHLQELLEQALTEWLGRGEERAQIKSFGTSRILPRARAKEAKNRASVSAQSPSRQNGGEELEQVDELPMIFLVSSGSTYRHPTLR